MRFGFLVMALIAEVQSGLVSMITSLTLPPDVGREVDFLNDNDYVAYAETHGMNLTFLETVTSDGWVLQIWRVRSMEIYDAKLSAPVIIAPGLGSSAFDYMWNLRNQSTAFVLADNGYDVFGINFRGTQFSNKIKIDGTTRDPKPENYFKATWQYMADYDLPAVFDKVLKETGQSKFYLLGHSMGTTASFAFLSENHSYDDKLSHFAAVVPVLKLGEDVSPSLKVTFAVGPPLTQALQVTTPIVNIPFKVLFKSLFGVGLPATSGNTLNKLQSLFQSTACGILPGICDRIFSSLTNRESQPGMSANPHLNKTRSAIYFNKFPAGTTLMNVYNYGIQWKKESWTKIDFRKIPLTGFTNEEEYNQTEPPEYDFRSLKVPYSLFYTRNDAFTGVKTAEDTIAMLNATDFKIIDGNKLSHTDAVIGVDTRCFTINDIMLRFEALENERDGEHREFRDRVADFVNSLPFENGCLSSRSE